MLLPCTSACSLLLLARPPLRVTTISSVATENALTVLGGALAKIGEADSESNRWVRMDRSDAWALLPPKSTPWGCVHFVGGAGFGTAPQICYDHVLSSVVERTGVAVVATPFELGTDHNALSKAVHAAFASAQAECCERFGLSPAAPLYRLGHSLGAKLLVLGALEQEGGGDETAPAAPLGLLAFNNFGLSDSVELASQLLSRMQGGGGRSDETARAVLDAFNVVQQVASAAGLGGAAGLDVSPTPEELNAAVAERYAAPSTRLWRFGTDNLDSSDGLLAALPPSSLCTRTDLAGLSHLAPVVFRLEAKDVDPNLELLLGSGRGFSFGDAAACAPLCDELCNWLWPSKMAPRVIAAAAGAAAEEEDDDSPSEAAAVEVLTD